MDHEWGADAGKKKGSVRSDDRVHWVEIVRSVGRVCECVCAGVCVCVHGRAATFTYWPIGAHTAIAYRELARINRRGPPRAEG